MYIAYDLLINLCSDVLFVGLAFSALLVLRGIQLTRARRFFGLREQTTVKVLLSGFEHKRTATKRVAVVVEYEAAIKLAQALRHLSGEGIIPRLFSIIAGLVGQEPRFLRVDIGVSKLEAITQAPPYECLVLVGGPLRNKVTKYYTEEGTPRFTFDRDRSRFLERQDNDEYRTVNTLRSVAFLEKRIIDGQTVFTAFGAGEKETEKAVQYLANNWRRLKNQYQDQSFGIRLSVDEQGHTEVEKVILG